eukprot:CAMPEP_0182861746 /NCGR_PEP_ID=MMETSP0034_2-20130328/5665_1 /TAXON_ID=156128 /ORGANISM="Nephroselmis pyriformis, Strain CCMP717" /LENGTH=37 /DNA_ID= /DNA_START= /DNA_END= /DNA_ORIENTATION=
MILGFQGMAPYDHDDIGGAREVADDIDEIQDLCVCCP